ncbi:hypothetical protein QTP88_012945 [Uroleucon formosanum]
MVGVSVPLVRVVYCAAITPAAVAAAAAEATKHLPRAPVHVKTTLLYILCERRTDGVCVREKERRGKHGADKSAYLLRADDEWSIESAKLQCSPAPSTRTNPTNPIFSRGTAFRLIFFPQHLWFYHYEAFLCRNFVY